MIISLYGRVKYIGPDLKYPNVSNGDFGYVIEDYCDGNYEIEFSNKNGISTAQCVICLPDLESAEA